METAIRSCVAFNLLFLAALDMGKRPRVLLACASVLILIAVWHTVFHLLWN